MRQTTPDIEGGSLTPPRRPTRPDEVSPANTYDTELMSPSRSFDSPSSPRVVEGTRSEPQSSKIAIEHIVHQTRGKGVGAAPRSAGLILGMSKPALGIATVLLLGSGAAAAFGWFFQIPGLNAQVKQLEEQVGRLNVEISRLSSEVDRLEDENDRYEDLNNQLNVTVVELGEITDGLNQTVNDLEDITLDLNTTNQELKEEIDTLEIQNENYQLLNQELNVTATQLAQDVVFFQDTLQQLVVENSALSNLTATLEGVTLQLGNLTIEQNETLQALQETLEKFMNENDVLSQLNSNLVAIVNFLNATTVGLDNSLNQITDFLADEIEKNQLLVLENIETFYRQKLSNWDCDYRDTFREEDFALDYSLPIQDTIRSPSPWDKVLTFVDQRVLSELCLDPVNFEVYMKDTYPVAEGGITTYRLFSGVLQYTTAAIDFYFPEPGEIGAATADWAEAGFKCHGLPETYRWVKEN